VIEASDPGLRGDCDRPGVPGTTDRPGAHPDLRAHWALDPEVVFLNHGSFGATPRAVLEDQARWRERMESDPVRFFVRDLDGLLAGVRAALGGFLGADPDDLALVTNATAGVNTVVRSLAFRPGDELLATGHEYNASLNALRFAAERDGARVVIVDPGYPAAGPDDVAGRVLAAVTSRTRLAMLSHVTSPTAIVLPVERLVPALRERGVETLVDGAHAPGMLPLDLDAVGAAYYTGNCHKWVCAPKGAAFLHVRRDLREAVRPLAISHGANDPDPDRPRFRKEFDWTGTDDPTPWLAIPAALDLLGGLLPGGWPGVMAANRALALRGRDELLAALGGIEPGPAVAGAPDAMTGSMATVALPGRGVEPFVSRSPLDVDPIGAALWERWRIEVPVLAIPAGAAGTPRGRLVRISAQLYDTADEYALLGSALAELCAA
jgi:isopenicillin-N epimerase